MNTVIENFELCSHFYLEINKISSENTYSGCVLLAFQTAPSPSRCTASAQTLETHPVVGALLALSHSVKGGRFAGGFHMPCRISLWHFQRNRRMDPRQRILCHHGWNPPRKTHVW